MRRTEKGSKVDGTAHYFHWGFIYISMANLIVILLMVLIFTLAVVLPMPGSKRDRGQS